MNCDLTEAPNVLARADAASKGTDMELACSLGRWEREDALETLSGDAAGRASPPRWAERQDRARHPEKRGGANMGEMFSGNPVGVNIPLTIRLNVFICGCCPGPGHPYLSTPREEALLVRLCRVGKQHPLLSAEGNPDLPVRKGDIKFQGKVIFPL